MKTKETLHTHATRATALRTEAHTAHPALAHALRRRAAEIEMQSWLEDVAGGSTTTVDIALGSFESAEALAA